ncbi:agamous-like MADS-box protein AGL15 isoform X2 [Carya illinoinensis]|uniref:agamous-like MADS-box protein AGL15 isoform X2 n=1 Tax=Carya illinoinensis TaxID=32201 RepID=UPI001C718054|nr:agamous-like MADS-box protein AGL15 isoform X2 [Carya illinoinensis]
MGFISAVSLSEKYEGNTFKVQRVSRFSRGCISRIQSRVVFTAYWGLMHWTFFFLQKQDSKEVDVLKDEISKLHVKHLRLLGKDLTGLGLKELQQLEQQLSEGLLSVKERKEQLLMEQLEQSRMQEQQTMLENETLRRQVEELRGFFPPADHPVPSYRDYYPVKMQNTLADHGVGSPEVHYNYQMQKEDSDITLHLGLPIDVYSKMKEPETGILSNDSGSQMAIF